MKERFKIYESLVDTLQDLQVATDTLIMGYIRSRNFCKTTNKLRKIQGFSSASSVSKSFIFVEVMLLEKFENKKILQSKPVIQYIFRGQKHTPR